MKKSRPTSNAKKADAATLLQILELGRMQVTERKARPVAESFVRVRAGVRRVPRSSTSGPFVDLYTFRVKADFVAQLLRHFQSADQTAAWVSRKARLAKEKIDLLFAGRFGTLGLDELVAIASACGLRVELSVFKNPKHLDYETEMRAALAAKPLKLKGPWKPYPKREELYRRARSR